MRDEVERLKNSKSVNYKKDIRFPECLSSSAEEETWTLTVNLLERGKTWHVVSIFEKNFK